MLILASGSRSRAEMLRAAGVEFDIQKAYVDEEPLQNSFYSEGTPARDIADMLAEMKALSVSMLEPSAHVIGADQVLVFDGRFLSKAETMQEAKTVLQAMSGHSIELISAVAAAQNGQVIWRAMDKAKLKVRPLNDAFIDDYLDSCGEGILNSVGCFHLEGRGAQLFEKIEGDYFTVLGMPLLKVLHFLRQQGLMTS